MVLSTQVLFLVRNLKKAGFSNEDIVNYAKSGWDERVRFALLKKNLKKKGWSAHDIEEYEKSGWKDSTLDKIIQRNLYKQYNFTSEEIRSYQKEVDEEVKRGQQNKI